MRPEGSIPCPSAESAIIRRLMGGMYQEQKNLLAGGAIIVLLAGLRRRKMKMQEDFDIPEFMRPTRILCEEPHCVKRAIRGSKKCIDCEVEESMPKVLDQVEDILAGNK